MNRVIKTAISRSSLGQHIQIMLNWQAPQSATADAPPPLRSIDWTKAEDDHLLAEKERCGGKWTTFNLPPGRTLRSCQNRYWTLRCRRLAGKEPKRRQPAWSKKEDSLLLAERARVGRSWVDFKPIPGRSLEACRSRYQNLKKENINGRT